MRSVTFVQRITIEVAGSVAQNSVLLADANSDGEYELLVGSAEGDISIYKGSTGEVWKKCSNLGCITAIGVGDLLNKGRNVVVATSACGWLYIFDLNENLDLDEIEPSYRQRVPANIRDLIISDINSDGRWELIVSLTDRVVRMYRWNEISTQELFSTKRDSREMNYSSSHNIISTSDITTSSRRQSGSQLTGRFVCINKWEVASQIGTVSFNMDSEGNPAVLIGQPGGAFMRLCCKQKETDQETVERSEETVDTDNAENKSEETDEERVKSEDTNNKDDMDLQQTEDSNQYSSTRNISNSCNNAATSSLMSSPSQQDQDGEEQTLQYKMSTADQDIAIQSMTVEYEPMGIQRRSNPNVSSEILGGFKTGGSGPGTRYAIVTLDGSV